MSFLRHARSIGPMGQLKTILRLKPCGASRWSAPGFAAGRDCNTAPSLIVRDEYAPAIPWRVALQQSLPPFHRMRPVCYESICRSRDFHRTASCVLTVCLGPGGHRLCTCAYRRTRLSHTPSNHPTRGGLLQSPKWVGSIIGTSVAPPEPALSSVTAIILC